MCRRLAILYPGIPHRTSSERIPMYLNATPYEWKWIMAKEQVRPLSPIKHLIRGMLMLLVCVNFRGRGRGCFDCWFNCERDAEKACGSFAGLSAAPLCTVLHFRQRTSRFNAINNNQIGRKSRAFNPWSKVRILHDPPYMYLKPR